MRNLCHEWHCWSWFQTEITISVHLVGLKVLLCKKCTWRRGTSSRRFAFSKIHFLFTPKVQEQQRRRHISHYWRRGFSKGFFLLIYGTKSGDRTYDKILLVIGDPDADTIDGETIWDDHYGDNALDVPLFWFRFPTFLSAHLRNVHLFSIFCNLHCRLHLKSEKEIHVRTLLFIYYNCSNTKIVLPYKWGLTILS